MTLSPTKILIIDDHRLFSEGLAMLLSQLDGHPAVSTCHNVRTLLEDIESVKQYDVVLVDLKMPTIDGFGFLHALATRKIKIAVIVVSSTEDKEDIERALQLGAMGFIPKNSLSSEMLNGVRAVLNGKRFVPEHLVGAISWPTHLMHTADQAPEKSVVKGLRPRQIEVLNLMHAGHSNTEIAVLLGISESAIKAHVSKLFKALHVKNRTACVRAGEQHNLISSHSSS